MVFKTTKGALFARFRLSDGEIVWKKEIERAWWPTFIEAGEEIAVLVEKTDEEKSQVQAPDEKLGRLLLLDKNSGEILDSAECDSRVILYDSENIGCVHVLKTGGRQFDILRRDPK